MSEKTPLAANSPQFAYLEYFLQLCLCASSARIVAAHALSNPHNTVQFEKRCKDILTLDTWIDPAQLPPSNSEDEVLRRGFAFTTSSPGLKVGIGSLRVAHRLANGTDRVLPTTRTFSNWPLERAPSSAKSVRRAILCKVGIGRAYVNTEDGAVREALPEGYDSFYCLSDQEPADEAEQYFHSYYITNAAQVLPMYLVQYEYDPEKEKKLREKAKCDNCETAMADFYCASDAANLCKNCDLQLHSANKLASRHIRTPIGKGVDVFGHCRHHADKLVEFFCSQCHVPVCVHCKMVGHHSAGEAAKHKLVSVSEAYQTVIAESQLADNILSTRKQVIHNQLASIGTRAKSLEKHVATIQNQIEEIYKRALAELKSITKRKMDVLHGDECELRRQLGEISRLESFLAYQQGGDATHFLFSWARHQQLRQELHDFRFFRDNIDVQLDVKCSGNISVLVEPPSGATAGSLGSSGSGLLGLSGGPGDARSGSTSGPGSPVRRYSSPTKPRSPTAATGSDDTRSNVGVSTNATANPNSRTTVPRLSSAATTSTGTGGASLGGMVASGKQGNRGSNPNAGTANSTAPNKIRAGSTPKDFFSEALGALDEISNAGGHGAGGDYVSEFSFAEGEGYISD